MKIRYIEYENGTWSVEREKKGWFRTRWVRMVASYWKDNLDGAIWHYPSGLKSSHREYRTRFRSEEEARDVYEKSMHLEEDRERAGRVRRIVN